MSEMPDLSKIRGLVALAGAGSFTLAAERLGVTQSAVSHSIRSLERMFGLRLVVRSVRGVRLTEAGEVLLLHFEKILVEMEMAGEEVENLKRKIA